MIVAKNNLVKNLNTNRGGDNLVKNPYIEHSTEESMKFDNLFPTVRSFITDEQGEGIDFADILFNLAHEVEKPEKETEKRMAIYHEDLAKAEKAASKWQGLLGYLQPVKLLVSPKHSLVAHAVAELEEFLFCFDYESIDSDCELLGVEIPEGKDGKVIDTKFTSQDLFFTVFAEAVKNLTADQFAELICDLYHEQAENNFIEKLEEGQVRIRHMEVNFNDCTLNKNGYILHANRGTMFRNSKVDVLGPVALFLFAVSIAYASKKAINTRIGYASNLFKRQENYGCKANSDDIKYHINNNLVLCAQNKGTQIFPFFKVESKKQDGLALGHILGKGIFAAVDKTNVKWLTVEDGALAMGLGHAMGVVHNISDASKPNKVYNRPASLNYSFATLPNRVRSNFAFLLSEGKKAYIKGRSLNVLYTNSIIGVGSGVALSNPNLRFPHTVNTSVTEPINLLTFPAEMRRQFKSMELFAKHIEGRITESLYDAVGKVFKPGEVIAELEIEGEEKPRVLIRNTKTAVDVMVKSSSVRLSDFNDNVLDVSVKVDIAGDDRYVKLRTAFYKATTCPTNVKIEGIAPSEWDLILNNETVKGQNALMVMWANEQEGVVGVDMMRGIAVKPDGTEVDLKVFENEIAEWRRQSKFTTKLTFVLPSSVYEELKHQFEGHKDIEIISKGKHTVKLAETVECIKGKLNFDVEIATPRECVGTSNLTFEQQNAILLQDRKLGLKIMDGLTSKVKAFNGLIKTYAEDSGKEVPTFNVATIEGRDTFAKAAFGGIGKFISYVSNHRSILKCLGKAFPQGVKLLGGEEILELHPAALMAFGQFSRNGSSAREVAKVIDFLFYIVNVNLADTDAESEVKSNITDAAFAISAWSNNLVNSSKALKKVTRAGELVCGKVRTSFNLNLHSEDGIPVVVLNPHCPIVRRLGVKEGDLVGMNRTPMPFTTIARVKFDTSIDWAHVIVSPLWWHAANEGDSDGDGIGLFNASKLGVTDKRAHKINDSLMGPAGYFWMYGNVSSYSEYIKLPANKRPELPFDEFMSRDDKFGKKAISFNEKNSNPIITTSIKGEAFTLGLYAHYADLVNSHYKAAVGSSYAVCSQLVFAASEYLFHGEKVKARFEATLKACVVSWRLVYEGLSLAGWTPNADTYFRYYAQAAKDYEVGRVKEEGKKGEIVKSFYFKGGHEVNALPILSDCLAEAGIHKEVLTSGLLRDLLRAQAVCLTYVGLEKYGTTNKSLEHLESAAVVAGALRRIGQGKDPAEILEDDAFAAPDENVPMSMTVEFHERGLAKVLKNPAFKGVGGAACAAHSTLREIFASLMATK